MYTLQYTYDVGSRVTVAQDPLSRYSYVYNQNDQVTKVTSGNVGAAAVVLDSVYDLLGRRTELKATVAGKADFRNTYQYDALSRMTQVAQQAQVSTNPVQQKRVNYAYTPAGDRRQVTRWADVAGTRAVATTDWVYDAGGRLSELTHRANTTGTVLNAYRWSYDALGRPVSESSSDGVSTWQYDASSQVTAADHTRQASERYTYDATGNRTAATQSSGTANTITTGANNRLLADDRYRYEYDAEGNRTRRTDLATENYQLLTWDHRNRLTAVTSHTATGTKSSQVTYTYDLYDRRISRSVDADGNGTFETVQRFAYDGSDLVLAFSGSTNRLTNRYLHGPAIDEILADEQLSTTGAGTVIWSLADRLGTVRDLVQYNTTTSTTTLVNHIQYDTFGQLTSQTNTSQTPWFGYTGREWDTATGLTYYRARWYDPRAGRFISEDPLSFAAGDVNLNRYVGNGATLWVDPSGMQLTGQYLPGISRQAYSDYLQSQSAIANFMADPKEVAAFLNRNGLYEDAFIDDYINQLDPSNRLDHLRQGLKEGLAELERQVQEHLVEQAMSAAVGPALGAASFVARKGVAKIAFQRLRKKSARAAGMRATGRLTGTAGSNAAEEMARREAAAVAARKLPALTNEAKGALRASAVNIWQARTGRRAVWDGMDVHHWIPLEWSHLFPNAEPNRVANLIGMKSADHTLVTNAWNAWRQGLNGRVPTQAEVLEQALRVDEQFGKLMTFLP